MQKILVFLLIWLFPVLAFAQEQRGMDRLNQEVASCVAHLKTFDVATQPYIKYFSLYNIENNNIVFKASGVDAEIKYSQKDLYKKVLDFWIHSVSYGSSIRPSQQVPNSDSLFWVDIRNYLWSIQAWETVMSYEPYFREPWIDSSLAYEMRLLSGNAICRADWFIVHISDTTKQIDFNDKDTPLYYVLLYSSVGIPKTVDEFMDRWAVDKKKILSLEILSGVLIDEGDSGVSRHNRQLARARTELGYFYETSDVKHSTSETDYLETLEPGVFARSTRDAGEQITTNKLGLQVYFLSNGAGQRVEFGDPTVVWDRTDTRDVRVRTARSCVICHVEGLNLPEDGLKNLLDTGVIELHTYDYYLKNSLESFYLGDFTQFIHDDRILYSRAVQKVTGVIPDIFVKLYRHVLIRFEEGVDLERAARECGVTLENFTAQIAVHTTSGRLASLFNGFAVPRQTWEEKNGTFTQAMVLLRGLELVEAPHIYEVIEECPVKWGKKTLGVLNIGERVQIETEYKGWFKIIYNGQTGYIHPKNLRLVQ